MTGGGQGTFDGDGVPTAHVVLLRGADHYVYSSNEVHVPREMKSFLSTLR